MKHPSPMLEDKLRRLYGFRFGIRTDLAVRSPYLNLLQKFGNPHLDLPPVIHVAGTNGKGSIIAMLRSILEAEGYKLHAYTSPHLVQFNERIVLAGEPINDEPLEALIDEALMLNDGAEVTFFEITTAIAFAAFARNPADIVLLEVGMGGRLDCTNVIEAPLVSVINMIDYDHTEFLGETLSEIATEKAGIIKDNCPCIIGAQNPQASLAGVYSLLESKAKDKNAPCFRYGADWLIEPFDEDQPGLMRFVFRGEEMILPRPALGGAHQIYNAGAALAALKTIENRFPVSDQAYEQGLQKAHWPARLQKQNHDKLPQGWALYLDGGHNESAGRALAQVIEGWQADAAQDVHLIFGMMGHKNPQSFLAPLLPLVKTLSVVPIAGEPESLQTLPGAQSYKNVDDAILALVADQAPGRILIAGSLYLAGDVLREQAKR